MPHRFIRQLREPFPIVSIQFPTSLTSTPLPPPTSLNRPWYLLSQCQYLLQPFPLPFRLLKGSPLVRKCVHRVLCPNLFLPDNRPLSFDICRALWASGGSRLSHPGGIFVEFLLFPTPHILPHGIIRSLVLRTRLWISSSSIGFSVCTSLAA